MNRNNYAGLPYSDELYHHGIIGQKWGVRRFQNADGTWTAAGKERYGSGKAKEVGEKVKSEAKKIAKAVGNASKRATKYAVKRFKMKHPSLMSDEELIELKKRLDLERTVKDARRELKKNSMSTRLAETTAFITKQAATNFATTLATNAAQNAAKNMFKTKSEKLKERNNELNESRQNIINDMQYKFSKAASKNMDRQKKYSDNMSKVDQIDEHINKINKKTSLNAADKTALKALKLEKSRLSKSNKTLLRDFRNSDDYLEDLRKSMKSYGFNLENKQNNNQPNNQPQLTSKKRKRHH